YTNKHFALNDLVISQKLQDLNTPNQKFLDEEIIWKHYHTAPENNLLQYLRKTYGDSGTNDAKESYVIGSTLDGGTVFWQINHVLQVQKAKICYYDENGRRGNKFKVPYKNE